MAEILVKKRKHWAEDVKPAECSDLKWSARPMSGDIVEVQPNGFYRIEALGTGVHGWNRDAFAVVRVPNASVETCRYLAESYSNTVGDAQPTVWFKRRYRIPDVATRAWNKNIVTVNGVSAEEWYRDFNNISLFRAIVVDKVT